MRRLTVLDTLFPWRPRRRTTAEEQPASELPASPGATEAPLSPTDDDPPGVESQAEFTRWVSRPRRP